MNESRTDIVIRSADASDARALARLAALDGAPAPGPGSSVLVAEANGEIVAALAGDRAIADPFRPTAGLVELLRTRSRQLHASSRSRRRFPRVAPRRLAHA